MMLNPVTAFNLTACHNMLFDIKKIIFNMYNCCCKRFNENRDKLYWLSIFSTWCNLLNDKVKPMYLFSADFHAAARAELFIFFSLPSGSTCASSGKILVAEPPTRKKGSFFLPRWRIRCQNFPRGYFRLPLSISRQMSLGLGVVVQKETRITTFLPPKFY